MRIMPSRYSTQARPVQIKSAPSRIQHVSAPLKGLSLSSKLTPGDPLTAVILKNFVVDDDRVTCRAGYVKIATAAVAAPIHHLIPWYGGTPRLLAASNNNLLDAQTGAVIKGGFTSNDWHWSSFSNLGTADFTVMVNGANGVWSWDGTLGTGTGIVKETVTAPASAAYIVPDQFQIVLSHMNRLWFADNSNLAVYYLPLQQKSGEVVPIPLNAVFKRGGTIRAMYTWSIDGGMGLDDKLVIFTTNGECAIYSGIDPDTDLGLQGVYRFDAPMSKHSVVNYGGELYVLVATGLVPMSTMMRAEAEQLGKEDRAVISVFLDEATKYRATPGWMAFLNPSSGRLLCNIPQGAPNRYMQMVRHMPRPVWSQFADIPSRCWGWIDPFLYFGDDKGSIYRMHPQNLNDNGFPIMVDLQPSWSLYRTPAQKHFKMVMPHIITDGAPQPFLDFRVDYDTTPPVNQPDVSIGEVDAMWDTATWDVDYWAQDMRPNNNWQGVAALGRVGAPRLTAAILNCSFSVAGFDVLYEAGAAL